MDINALLHLKYVFAAVELGSMRQVALAFGVQESTVSRNILALEQYIDLQLFNRGTNGIRLTKRGRAWLGEVRVHYEKLHDALALACRNNETKTLHIGLSTPVGREFLPRLVNRFEKTNPSVDVIIEDVSHGRYASAIRRRTLDVAFVAGRYRAKSCLSETVWQERLSVLLPAQHRLCAKQTLSWADLHGEQLMIPLGREGTQFDPRFLARVTTFADKLIVRYCNAGQSTVIIDVQRGKGICLAGESLARAMSIVGTVWRPIVGSGSVNVVSAIWLASNPKRAVFRFVAIAKNMADEGCVEI
jgi:DNA-binding transcriptional LysR family regulator